MSPGSSDKSEAAAIQGASLLIVLQFLTRAITFIANQVLVRFLTAHLLGISTQLEVYYLSVLFFARESLRVAIQRQPVQPKQGTKRAETPPTAEDGAAIESQAAVNLGYLAIPLGIAVATGLGWAFQKYQGEGDKTVYGATSLRIYAFAAVLELLSEPSFVLMQLRLRFRVRAAAESTATFLRCTVTLAMAAWAAKSGRDLGVLPFALGQLAYGLSLLFVYSWHGSKMALEGGFSMLPTVVLNGGPEYVADRFFGSTLSLAASLMTQSIVKHFLTQGDTLLVSILSTTKDQGIYALANNYGGLVARLVLQPIEESSRNYFSRLLSTSHGPKHAKHGGKGQVARDAIQRGKHHLEMLLKTYLLLSAVVVTIGPVACPSLLALVAGRRWIDEGAGKILGMYCYYIPLLAINGVAEAFVASIATEHEVHIQSVWMGFFSLAFAVAGFVFLSVLKLGATGLVYANIVNMACRIIWCAAFIKKYFTRQGVNSEALSLLSLLPRPATIGVTVAAPFVLSRTLNLAHLAALSGQGAFMDLVVTGAAALPILLILGICERSFLIDTFQSLANRRGDKAKA